MPIVKCSYCGIEFDKKVNLKGNHFCSKKCFYLSRRSYNTFITDKDNGYIVIDNKMIILDKDDIERVSKLAFWGLNNQNRCFGCIRNSSKRIFISRFLMDCPDDMVVDHINRNPLDNRKENLRIVTQKENNQNKSIGKNNTSGITGVSFITKAKKWCAQIQHNKKMIFLGYFDDIVEAKNARLKAELEYWGIVK